MKIKNYSTPQSKYANKYVGFLKKFLKPKKPLRVVFDCSNGSTGPIIKKLITNHQQLTTFLINEKPDGNFSNHSPNPLDKGAVNQLIKEVKRRKADLGVIFDSDGDRAFFIDAKGRMADPDAVLRLLAWHLKPKKIVITGDFGALVKKMPDPRPKLVLSKVGRHFVRKKIKQSGADLAAERSGHFYFKDFFYWDSGIFTAVSVINAVSCLPYGLAEFIDLLPARSRMREMNFTVRDIKAGKLCRQIESLFSAEKNKKIMRLDGLKIEFNSPAGWRWFSFRQSNTSNALFRLDGEAETKELLDGQTKKIVSLLKKFK